MVASARPPGKGPVSEITCSFSGSTSSDLTGSCPGVGLVVEPEFAYHRGDAGALCCIQSLKGNGRQDGCARPTNSAMAAMTLMLPPY